MIDLRHSLEVDTLRNGTAVTIRAIRPEDKSRLVNTFKRLDPESVYTRFFHPRWMARVCRTELCFFTFGLASGDRTVGVGIGSALVAGNLTPSQNP